MLILVLMAVCLCSCIDQCEDVANIVVQHHTEMCDSKNEKYLQGSSTLQKLGTLLNVRKDPSWG